MDTDIPRTRRSMSLIYWYYKTPNNYQTTLDCWLNCPDNTKGRGQQPTEHSIALSWVTAMNSKYPEITHIINPITE
jgi:hypothetical protein